MKFVGSRKVTESVPAIRGLDPRVSPHQAPIGPTVSFLQSRLRNEESLAEDLTRRVMHAIQEWIDANELNRLPEEIAFEQALSILNSMYHIYRSQRAKRGPQRK